MEKLINAMLKKDVHSYGQHIEKMLIKSGFKLYRYIPILTSKQLGLPAISSDEYILKHPEQFGFNSLLDSYLYFNTPRFFNDPYDCVFGIGIDSFFREILKQGFDIKSLKNLHNELNTGDINLENYEDKVNDLKIPDDLKDAFLSITKMAYDSFKENDSADLDPSKFMKKLSKNPGLFKSLLMPSLKDKVGDEDIKQAFEQHFEKFQENENWDLINPISPKYNDIMDAAKEHNIDEVEKIQSYVSDGLNDFNSKIFDVIDTRFGLVSLSGNKNDPLMWSHYANSHHGVMIEYDLKGFFKNVSKMNYLIYPVDYSDSRITVDENILDNIDFANLTKKGNTELIKLFLKGLFTKHTAWQYENEWRFVALINDENNERKRPSPKISGVYLGNKLSEALKKEIEYQLKCNGSKAIVFEMINDINSYKLKEKQRAISDIKKQ